MVFGSIALVLLIFALGYANNILYIFVFLVISVAITSMYIANRNLEFIRFKNAYCSDLFAGEINKVTLTLENSAAKSRYAFTVSVRGSEEFFSISIPEISALSEKTVELDWLPQQRGWQVLPRFQIETTYPFDMLRAWRNYQSTDSVLVFPKKKGISSIQTSDGNSQNFYSQGLFRDHREYFPGDQVRRIDWRASSKHQELLIKNFENQEAPSYNLKWEDTLFIANYEDRISQLALWLDLCESQGFHYSLAIPRIASGSGKGLIHYRHCLKILAEMPEGLT